MKRKKKSLDILNLTLILTTVLFVFLIVFMMIGQKDEEVKNEEIKESFTTAPREICVVK